MNFNSFSLPEWLHYLENRHVEEIQLGLARIKKVGLLLNVLDLDATIISVAGTNGKGSTVAALEAIYLAAGYQVGSYTSPHLINFNERIRVNQQVITDEQLCTIFTIIENARGDIHLTYFEMVTLAALWHFKQYKLDVIILEVGLGGRLDATNIVDSDLAIITTIDFDHQHYLGNTKEAIGYEKAGILRMNKPFIYADDDPPKSVIEQSHLLNAPRVNYSLHCSDDHLKIVSNASPQLSLNFNLESQPIELPCPKINPKAAAAAVVASAQLHSILPIKPRQWIDAMQTVSIIARQQIVKDAVSTLFDVAHNPQAVALLAEYIKKNQPKGSVHAVFSGLKDKDLRGLIKPMQSYVDFWYPAVLSSNRAASKTLLAKAFLDENCSIAVWYNDPWEAYQMAKQQAVPGDLIVVYGSFLTVSAVMAHQMEWQEEKFDEISYG